MLHVRRERPVCGMRHRSDRNDNSVYAELGAVAGAVHGTRATISKENEIARIVAAPYGHLTQRVGHLSVDDAANAGGGFLRCHSERNRDLLPDRLCSARA